MADRPKTFISFGLSGASRRPGVKGTTVSNGSSPSIGAGSPVDPAGRQAGEPLVIPLRPEDSLAPATHVAPLGPAAEEIPKYDPTKVGLQVRRKRLAEAEPAVHEAGPPPSFLRRRRLSSDAAPSPTVNPDAYDKIPVEQFGAALLRGMGWREGEGIGRRRQVVAPLLPKARPKGLGLGADPQRAASKQGGREREGEKEKKEKEREREPAFSRTEALPGVGSAVRVTQGEQAGLAGTIAAILGESTALVRLGRLGGDAVGDKELAAIDISHLEVVSTAPRSTSPPASPPPRSGPSWMLPHIRVRLRLPVRPPSLGDILDTHPDEQGILRAQVRLADGKIVASLHQDQLEPLHPTAVGTTVLIVASGEHHGERATVMDIRAGKDGDWERICHVQLLDSLEIIATTLSSLAVHSAAMA